MLNDLRLGARLLAKDWGFTAAAVAALVVGMAATIMMFTIIHGVYLRPLPFTDPERIVAIGMRPADAPDAFFGLSLPDVRDTREAVTQFAGIGASDEGPMDLADDEHAAERYVGAYVSANTFALIGQRPLLGRDFAEEDDHEGAEPVVILGYSIWQRRYGGNTGIIGVAVRVNGVPSTVIGVMPEGFGFPVRSALWQPLGVRRGDANASRAVRSLDAVGRLKAGVTVEHAAAELDTVFDRIARLYPDTNGRLTNAVVRPFRDMNTRGPIRAAFTGLMGSVVFLLLIACANVANLLLARGATRAREIAVRLSLGATRVQIVRQLLAESLVLAVLAGSLGLALAAAGVRLFRQSVTGTGEPYWVQVPIEGWVFAFVAGVCLATTVLCGLAPALHAAKTSLRDTLADADRRAVGAVRARRWTDTFVVVQVALSLTLLAGAGLMMRNVVAFATIDVGVETADLTTAGLTLPPQRYPDEDARRSFYRQLGEQLSALTGMRAGFASAPPLRGAAPRRISIPGRTPPSDDELPVAFSVTVGPGYLETLGVRAVRGRLFDADEPNASRIVIVNERFVEEMLRGEEAIGRSIRVQLPDGQQQLGEPLTIVGVVPNVRQVSPRQDTADAQRANPVMYLPYAAAPLANTALVVRSSAGPAAVAAALRDAVGRIDADLPLLGLVSFGEAIADDLRLLTVFGSMFGLFAAAAVGIAGVGLYGVTAYAAAQRRRELGVRIALGARAPHVWWLVTRRTLLQVGLGTMLGLAGAIGAGQLLQGLLTGVGSRDPFTLVAVPALMFVVALAACIIPARRAMRLDPAAALRAE
jgi:putative ABC transport system permease protein